MAQIELDDAAIKTLVGEGIMAQLTEDKRNEIIRQAVQNLFVDQEQDQGYGRKRTLPSQFMEAFQNAARNACQTILHEEARNPESPLHKAVHEKVAEMLMLLGDPGSEYASDLQRQIGQVIGEVISKGWSQRTHDGDRF